MTAAPRNVLEPILREKRLELEALLAAPAIAPRRSPKGGVLEALSRRPLRTPRAPLHLIAEVKLRSPSAGLLSAALRPAERALAYARAGARMVSVLTDGPFFGGSFGDLAACRDALDEALGKSRPLLLCKDFILDARQLDLAADAGADAALLIARILDAETLAQLVREALRRGLEPLVEIVSDEERVAAMQAGARLVGVNARDLDTLVIDRTRSATLIAALDDAVVAVHLSGLATPTT